MSGIDSSEHIADVSKKVKYQRTRTKHGSLNHKTSPRFIHLPGCSSCYYEVKCPMTLEEIGEKFDLTRERVRQIKEKAIRRLKHTSRCKILKTYLG
jgi:hypothetical protein